MQDKTAKQLLRLVINGVGLRTTLNIVSSLVNDAARAEDEFMEYVDKQSPFHRAAHEIGQCAATCYNENLDGQRLKETHNADIG